MQISHFFPNNENTASINYKKQKVLVTLQKRQLKDYIMTRFINPFTDFGFKKIFGQEINKDLLIEFLNDLLVGERKINDLVFLNNEQLPGYEQDRGTIYDIYCTTDTGEHIIVEMQNQKQINFRERALYYISRAIVGQAERGSDWKFELSAVYGVFFMNFCLPGENIPKLRTDVILADRETGDIFSNKLRQVFIALPLFKKEEHECETDFERWIYILKNMETLKRLPFKARKAVFEKLEEIADVAALSKEERQKYENSRDVYRTHLAVIEAAKEDGWEEGKEEGRKEGRKEGIKEGIKEGREKGIKEANLQNARNMKALGMEASIISQITGLTTEEITAL